MKLSSRLLALVPALAACLLAPTARANTITGIVYCNTSSADANSTPMPGSSHSGTACASFSSSSINFNNYGANTLGSFLNSGTLLGSVTYLNGYSAASNLDASLFSFSGNAYFTQGQTYSATHDDGTVMVVGGSTLLFSPGQTSPLTNTFTFGNASGVYNFQYNYTEAYGGSIYSTDATASPVPEPQSLVLLSTGSIVLLGFVRLRSTSAGTLSAAAAD